MELDMNIVLDYIRINNLCRNINHNPFGMWDKELVISYWKVKQDNDLIISMINLNEIYN